MFYMHASLFDINVYYMPMDDNNEKNKNLVLSLTTTYDINYTGFLPFLPHTYKAISTLNLISTAERHISCHHSTLKAGCFDSTDSATALVRPALRMHYIMTSHQYQNLKITSISSILPLKQLKSLPYPTH